MGYDCLGRRLDRFAIRKHWTAIHIGLGTSGNGSWDNRDVHMIENTELV